tara:strand:+ start:452 stop:673 length:222 start_codon:yes stop_codon:yes gene_type:complete
MEEKKMIKDIVLDYCEGDTDKYWLEFPRDDLSEMVEKIKQLVKKEIRDYAEDVASCSRPAEHVDDAIRCIDSL